MREAVLIKKKVQGLRVYTCRHPKPYFRNSFGYLITGEKRKEAKGISSSTFDFQHKSHLHLGAAAKKGAYRHVAFFYLKVVTISGVGFARRDAIDRRAAHVPVGPGVIKLTAA